MLLGIPYLSGQSAVYLIVFMCVRSTYAYRDIQERKPQERRKYPSRGSKS
jgi:hypothetical protein